MEILGLVGALVVLYVIAGVAALYGADSRDADDWARHARR